jgi:adenylate kinase
MIKKKLFMIGGAKGVGKSSLLSEISTELAMEKIETGNIVHGYVNKGLPFEGLNDYITQEIYSRECDNLILDTHYVSYNKGAKEFGRGLKTENLEKLAEKFDIYPCLVEISLDKLEQRRKNDDKKQRILDASHIAKEVESTRKIYQSYLSEINKESFILTNDNYTTAKESLTNWIKKNSR